MVTDELPAVSEHFTSFAKKQARALALRGVLEILIDNDDSLQKL